MTKMPAWWYFNCISIPSRYPEKDRGFEAKVCSENPDANIKSINIEVQIMMSACFIVEGAADAPSLSGGEFMSACIDSQVNHTKSQ